MDTTLLAAYFLAAMLGFTPLSQHAFYESHDVTEARYVRISETIAEGVLSLEGPLTDKGRIHRGLLMVSIGDAESRWNTNVVSCSVGGDSYTLQNGTRAYRSWGPWQTQLPKARVCESTKAAFTLAMAMVDHSFSACERLPLADRLSEYTDGRCIRNWKRSSYRVNRAVAWFDTHPFAAVKKVRTR